MIRTQVSMSAKMESVKNQMDEGSHKIKVLLVASLVVFMILYSSFAKEDRQLFWAIVLVFLIFLGYMLKKIFSDATFSAEQ